MRGTISIGHQKGQGKGMTDQKHRHFIGRKQLQLLFVTMVVIIIAFSVISYTVLLRDLKTDLGNKAMVLAIDITQWLQVTSGESQRLLALDFNQLLKDPANRSFESKGRQVMAQSEIKYIYLLSDLPEGQAKYIVGPDETAEYGVPAGTPMTGVYLLDAVVSDEQRLEDTDGQGYTDHSRYTVLHPEVKAIFQARQPAYLLNTDEWGTYLTGYAPYYTEQGEFLGMLGVDLFPDKYFAYVSKSLTIFTVFLLIMLLTGLSISRLLKRVWRVEERIRLEDELSTTDSLTGLMNRRSFMGLLTHEYAICRREGMPLILMLGSLQNHAQYSAAHGPEQGDQALIETAAYLKGHIKRGSDALCRYGSSDFAWFMHNTEPEHAEGFADAVAADAPHPMFLGILAVLPEEALALEQLLEKLEEAQNYTRRTGVLKTAWFEVYSE